MVNQSLNMLSNKFNKTCKFKLLNHDYLIMFNIGFEGEFNDTKTSLVFKNVRMINGMIHL